MGFVTKQLFRVFLPLRMAALCLIGHQTLPPGQVAESLTDPPKPMAVAVWDAAWIDIQGMQDVANLVKLGMMVRGNSACALMVIPSDLERVSTRQAACHAPARQDGIFCLEHRDPTSCPALQ